MPVLENTVNLHEIAVVVNSSGPTGSALSHCAVYVIGLGNLSSQQTTGTSCCSCPHAARLSGGCHSDSLWGSGRAPWGFGGCERQVNKADREERTDRQTNVNG